MAANQAASTNYSAAAQVTASIVVNQATQTISFAPASPVTYGVSPITLTATGGASGNAVTFSVVSGPGSISGSTLTVTGVGTIVVAANQAASTNYSAAAQVTASIVVNPATQTISFAPASPVTYGVSPITLTATGGASGNAVLFSVVSGPGSISGSTLTVTGVGTIVVAANQAASTNYSAAAQVTASIVVNPATQTISFAPASPVTYGVSPITLTATGGASGNAVLFSVVSGPGSISGSTLTVTGAGTIVVAANQAASTNYSAAAQVTASIVVNPATASVNIVASANPVLSTNPITWTATVAATSGSPTGNVSFFDGATLLGTVALAQGTASYTTSSLAIGTHSITAVYAGDANFASSTSSALAESVQDYSLTISGSGGDSSSTSQTVFPGGTATYSFVLQPSSGTTFPSPITLTLSGVPSGATATITPSTLPAGSSLTNVVLTVRLPQTTAGMQQNNQPLHRQIPPLLWSLLLLPFVGRLRRARNWPGQTAVVLLMLTGGLIAMTGLSGCGGNNGFFGQQQKTYAITITATSGTLSHSTTVTLTVQ